jgi:hypothetical protein
MNLIEEEIDEVAFWFFSWIADIIDKLIGEMSAL